MADTSKIVAIVATFPMFTAIYAYLFLGESPGPMRITGIAFIVIGSILIEWNLLAE